MILAIEHTTQFHYDAPIRDTVMELRLGPLTRPGQRILRFAIETDPSAPMPTYLDAFGNVVHTWSHRAEHEGIRITARTTGETGLASPPAGPLPATEYFGYRRFDGPVLDLPDVRALAASVERNTSTIEQLWAITRLIGDRFRYQPGLTQVGSTVADLLGSGGGVCQDFAHLWVALARALGFPARYVSGYVLSRGSALGADASHAWGEAWIDGVGWTGFDPTNRTRVHEQHLAVAVGRDYRDVAPTKGVYHGHAHETFAVNVTSRELVVTG